MTIHVSSQQENQETALVFALPILPGKGQGQVPLPWENQPSLDNSLEIMLVRELAHLLKGELKWDVQTGQGSRIVLRLLSTLERFQPGAQ